MKFLPPVNKRPTDELFEIISNNEKWGEEIQILAEEELFNRNYIKEIIEKERQKRIRLLEKIYERKQINLTRNKSESYTLIEMTSIILFFPLTLLIQLNPLKEFWELDKGNYKKKILQRLLLISASILLWYLFLTLIF